MIHSIHEYQKAPSTKSKYLLKRFSGCYEPLHQKSKSIDEIPLYVCPPPPHIKTRQNRKPSLILVNARKEYLSGLYFPLPENPFLAYGDIGADALLVIMENGCLEVLVCPDSKHLCMALYTMYADADPDMQSEIQAHRQAFREWCAEKAEGLS
jgi:hypothetical protein